MQSCAAPRERPTVLTPDVRYYAPHVSTRGSGAGILFAVDRKSNRLIWEQQIYDLTSDPKEFRGVVEVFITGLQLKEDGIEVTNQKGELYFVSLPSREVRRIR